jgi:hypothetical protein
MSPRYIYDQKGLLMFRVINYYKNSPQVWLNKNNTDMDQFAYRERKLTREEQERQRRLCAEALPYAPWVANIKAKGLDDLGFYLKQIDKNLESLKVPNLLRSDGIYLYASILKDTQDYQKGSAQRGGATPADEEELLSRIQQLWSDLGFHAASGRRG